MKLEVGMYVRTEIGIGKYEINKGHNCIVLADTNLLGAYDLLDEMPHSFNLIDLIEVGDYVNGWLVNAVYSEGMRLIGVEDGIEYNDEIKEVLTHEQYEANCYKIGE